MRKPKKYSLRLTADEVAAVGATMARMEALAKNEGSIPPMIVRIKGEASRMLEQIARETETRTSKNETLGI